MFYNFPNSFYTNDYLTLNFLFQYPVHLMVYKNDITRISWW